MSNIKKVHVFRDARKNEYFKAEVKRILLYSLPTNQTPIVNRNTMPQKSMVSCISKLNRSKIFQNILALFSITEKQTPVEILQTYIEQNLLNDKNKIDYTREDHIIAIAFACVALNRSKKTLKEKKLILKEIKRIYPDYNKELSLMELKIIENMTLSRRVEHYHTLTLKSRLERKAIESLEIPLEIQFKILAQNVPLEYCIATVPADQLANVIAALGINLSTQFAALRKMRKHAAGSRITPEGGEIYFDKQYGKNPIEQLIAFYNEFGKSPFKVLKDKHIEKAFVTETFIETWRYIKKRKIDVKVLSLPVQSSRPRVYNVSSNNHSQNQFQLYRLPRNIERLISLEELFLSDIELSSLPPEVGKLTTLKTLSLSCNQLTAFPPMIKNLVSLEVLFLEHNPFSSVPIRDIEALQQNLKHLYLPRAVTQKASIEANLKPTTQIAYR